MKKLFFLLSIFCIYMTGYSVNTYKYISFNDTGKKFKTEITFKNEDSTWTFKEKYHDLNANECIIVTEEHVVDFTHEASILELKTALLNEMECLSKSVQERIPNLVQLLDEETKNFLSNKRFVLIESEIFVISLHKDHQKTIIIKQKATPDERKICIKIKALEYALMKKALAESQ